MANGMRPAPVIEDLLAGADFILDRPGFTAAFRQAIGRMLQLSDHGGRAPWFLSDRVQALLSHLLLMLEAEGPDDRSGLTPSRFKALCADLGLCSPGRASALLILLQMNNLLSVVPDASDRRLRRLVPTDTLRAVARERLEVMLSAALHFDPDVAATLSRLDEPRFVRALYRAFAVHLAAGCRPVGAAPDLLPFTSRNSGILILFALAQAAQDEAAGEEKVATVAIAALARRFRTSRAHVLRLLGEAEASGLVQRIDNGRGVSVAPRLEAALRRFLAAVWWLILSCVTFAEAELCDDRHGQPKPLTDPLQPLDAAGLRK